MKNRNTLTFVSKIVVGGITGAFLLTGITVLASVVVALLIDLLAPLGWKFDFYTKEVSLEREYVAFIVAGIIGFALGAIMRDAKRIEGWSPKACIWIIPLLSVLTLWYFASSNLEHARQMKIVDCTDRPVRVEFKLPKGRGFQLRLVPGLNAFPIGGHVQLTDMAAHVTNDFDINSDFTQTNGQSQLIHELVDTFGAEVESVSFGKPTLEDVFVHLTGARFDVSGDASK